MLEAISKFKLSSLVLFAGFLVLLSALSLVLGSMTGCGCNKMEGFADKMPLKIDPSTNKIVSGYYKVDASNMVAIPYGYTINPDQPEKLVPKTNAVAQSNFKADPKISVPAEGLPLPEGYYKLTDSSLALLPPHMMPTVKSVDFTQDNPPILKIYYGLGFVSSDKYYADTFTPAKYTPPSLPSSSIVYFTDLNKTKVSFLPYGKIANTELGYGMTNNPNLKSSTAKFDTTTTKYRDIGNNYDVQFHETAEELQKKNKDDLNYGQVRVKDQAGNMIILPNVPTQNSVTYYQPGEFPFGSSNYVPNYEDSVYLSTLTKQSVTSPYATGTKPIEACKAYKDLKAQMERYCS